MTLFEQRSNLGNLTLDVLEVIKERGITAWDHLVIGLLVDSPDSIVTRALAGGLVDERVAGDISQEISARKKRDGGV
ncbi:hypothetical protein JW710_04835 [Candidatus Dojkabacteria bacterium]|nr:hypothetical protein [Candidatus Dojkabacteria bacterium]